MVVLTVCAIAAIATVAWGVLQHRIGATPSNPAASKDGLTSAAASGEVHERLAAAPADPLRQAQRPVKPLERKITDLRGLLPQPGDVLGHGLVFNRIDVRLEHVEAIRDEFIRAAAPDPNAPLDAVRAVGASLRVREGTGYVIYIVESRSV
ncbi:MAG: hypothetical protein C4340_05255, partial [Armatimonadota bacterium]